jgi:hypothetical protein
VELRGEPSWIDYVGERAKRPVVKEASAAGGGAPFFVFGAGSSGGSAIAIDHAPIEHMPTTRICRPSFVIARF